MRGKITIDNFIMLYFFDERLFCNTKKKLVPNLLHCRNWNIFQIRLSKQLSPLRIKFDHSRIDCGLVNRIIVVLHCKSSLDVNLFKELRRVDVSLSGLTRWRIKQFRWATEWAISVRWATGLAIFLCQSVFSSKQKIKTNLRAPLWNDRKMRKI